MTKWIIDSSHSEVHFKVKHLVISTVTGSFNKFEGEVESTTDDFTNATIKFSADIDSIDTNNAQRDGHLKSPEFFDVTKHPKLEFVSTSFTKLNDSHYDLKGNMTVRGITHPIDMKVEYGGTTKDSYGNTRAGFELTGIISRKEFGLTWSAVTEAGSVVVADDVKLIVAVELIKEA